MSWLVCVDMAGVCVDILWLVCVDIAGVCVLTCHGRCVMTCCGVFSDTP